MDLAQKANLNLDLHFGTEVCHYFRIEAKNIGVLKNKYVITTFGVMASSDNEFLK